MILNLITQSKAESDMPGRDALPRVRDRKAKPDARERVPTIEFSYFAQSGKAAIASIKL